MENIEKYRQLLDKLKKGLDQPGIGDRSQIDSTAEEFKAFVEQHYEPGDRSLVIHSLKKLILETHDPEGKRLRLVGDLYRDIRKSIYL